jgi:hypothetical protein
MATHARDSDRSTSHDAIDPASLEISVNREKTRLIHLMCIDDGLIDDTLGQYYGPTKDREHSKRRSDITVGSKAQCEKSLVAAEDCPGWIATGRETERRGLAGRMQKIWIFCKCPDKACMSRAPKLSLREEVIRLRYLLAQSMQEIARLKRRLPEEPTKEEEGFFSSCLKKPSS